MVRALTFARCIAGRCVRLSRLQFVHSVCGPLAVRMFVCCLQVAGTGNIFGAYLACAWPAVGDEKTVSDPSGRSFLFSLVNKDNKPVRFTLRDKNRALEVSSDGIRFGGRNMEGDKQVSWPNFALMRSGHPASHGEGNVATDTQKGQCAFQPEGAAMCDSAFLAGSQEFGAGIEVHQLQAPAGVAAASASSSSSAAAAATSSSAATSI